MCRYKQLISQYFSIKTSNLPFVLRFRLPHRLLKVVLNSPYSVRIVVSDAYMEVTPRTDRESLSSFHLWIGITSRHWEGC